MIADPGKAALTAAQWWNALRPDPDRERRGDRATLARLRRATTVSAAMMEPAAIDLFRRIGAICPNDLPKIALLAVVLAHVREDVQDNNVARLLGPKKYNDLRTARVSPLRFRRLLEAETLDERLTAFRRAVALARGAVPVRDLARSLLDWSDACRLRWTYDYWNAGQPYAAPAAEEPAVS